MTWTGEWRRTSVVGPIAAGLLVILAPAVPAAPASAEPQARAVILFIGDGMGVAQLRAGQLYAEKILERDFAMTTLPVAGLTITDSFDSEVTDSSSAATAIHAGCKINNAVLNILPDGRRVDTIAHAARAAGLAVGIVTTTRITHATPAALFAHVPQRDNENEVAVQLLEYAPEVVLGGGSRHFLPKAEKTSRRKDQRNLIEEARAAGYSWAPGAAELARLAAAPPERLLGLFSATHMDYELDRRQARPPAAQPSLADMTRAALAVLARDPDGFFLMVEGGRIDHACHSHDVKAAIFDVIALDEAVQVGLEFARGQSDTLIVVTADHETGGLGLGAGSDYEIFLEALKPIESSIETAGKQIARDPAQAEATVRRFFGGSLPGATQELLARHPADADVSALEELDQLYEVEEYVVCWAHHAVSVAESELAGVGWTSYAHTGEPVATFAAGPGARLFGGVYQNIEIAVRMAAALGLTLPEPRSLSPTIAGGAP